MKNSWKLAGLLCGAVLLTACGSETDTGSEGEANGGSDGDVDLVINSFTDELQYPIEVFEERNPGVNIDLQIIPTENYVDTLRPALESGSGAPDIFTGEIVYLLRLDRTGLLDGLERIRR
ncbi:MAG: extracellular solute-binding protein [Alkalibacterium sp.]|nr:extracellular solute-binding protein [Alkalibacterium sp.]